MGTASATAFDRVSKASHYNLHPSGVEVKHVTSRLGFNLANCFKYVVRHDVEEQGTPERSLRSAIWYLQEHRRTLDVAPLIRPTVLMEVEELLQRYVAAEPKKARAEFFEKFSHLLWHMEDSRTYEDVERAIVQLIAEL